MCNTGLVPPITKRQFRLREAEKMSHKYGDSFLPFRREADVLVPGFYESFLLKLQQLFRHGFPREARGVGKFFVRHFCGYSQNRREDAPFLLFAEEAHGGENAFLRAEQGEEI